MLACTILGVLLTLFLRLLFADSSPDWDSAGYALVGRHGGLYTDIPYDRPQGIFWVAWASLQLFGDSLRGLRIGAALWTAGTSALLVLLAHQLAGRRGALLVALLFPILSTAPSVQGQTADAETWANLPLVACAWLAWRGRFGWAGFLAGIASFLKPSGVSGLILAAGLALSDRAWRGAVLACVGFAVMPAVSMLAGWLVGWEAYWHSIVGQRLRVVSIATRGPVAQWERFFSGLLGVLPVVLAPLAGGVTALSWALPRERRFLLLWYAGTLFGGSIGALWWANYFIAWLPPLVVGCAVAAARFRPGRLAAAGATAAVIGVALFVALDVPHWRAAREVDYWRAAPTGALLAHIRATTRPADRIYVLDNGADIYFEARRYPAIPEHLFNPQLTPAVQDTVLARLARKSAALVVTVDSIAEADPAFITRVAPVIARHYKLEGRLGPFQLWRPR